MQRQSISKANDLNDEPNVKPLYSTHKKTTSRTTSEAFGIDLLQWISVSIFLVLFTYKGVGILPVFQSPHGSPSLFDLTDSLPFLVFFTSVVPQSHSLRQSSVIVQGERRVRQISANSGIFSFLQHFLSLSCLIQTLPGSFSKSPNVSSSPFSLENNIVNN